MFAIFQGYAGAYNGVLSPPTMPSSHCPCPPASHCRAYFIKYPRNLQYSEFSNSGDSAKASAVCDTAAGCLEQTANLAYTAQRMFEHYHLPPACTAYTPQVSAWSSDGQEILLEIGFYYRLPRDNLVNLYLEIGGTDNGHDDVVNKLDHLVLNIAAETFKHVSTKFETRQFFTERLAVKESMHQELVTRLEAFKVTVPRFQLLDIDVPASFASAVEGMCTV